MADPVLLAVETTKQLLTLSTAVITVNFAFIKDIVGQYSGRPRLIVSAVVLQILSIASGAWTLAALTGAVTRTAPDIYSTPVIVPAFCQLLCFVAGLVMMVAVIVLTARQLTGKQLTEKQVTDPEPAAARLRD